MSKSDLQARPIYHHKRDSIEAHLTIVFAALPVSRWIEAATRWPIRKFVQTARRYRTIQIQAGGHRFAAAGDRLVDAGARWQLRPWRRSLLQPARTAVGGRSGPEAARPELMKDDWGWLPPALGQAGRRWAIFGRLGSLGSFTLAGWGEPSAPR